MENITFAQRMKNIFKKYGYYFLLGALVFAVVLTLIIVGVSGSKDTPIVEDSTPVNTTVSPYLPVLNASIYKGYYGDELMYNATLKQWETHNGIDFTAASGSKVYSILDGVVKDVYSNVLEGQVVVVEHENGLVSTYGSLDENLNVKVGDSVNRGQQVGTISTTSTSEADAGAHLHFSLTDNGKKIDPASYLNIETK
ncbi:MAG: M23 family metallopeptidase [Clostridia bacterium]|nr:M23 family metallopeptidase [Clostridia bacterium]